VIGLIFKSEVLRDMLSDMLGKSRGGNRPSIDAASGRKKAGFRKLHQDFIDREKTVTIPDLWLRGSTKLKVNDSKGANAYEEHGRFNPNNHDRISLPWTEKEVTSIFTTVMVEYNAAMINWMKGTGGGSGAPENFSIWEQRDPVLFVNYSNQPARMYLSVVYMWDKTYQFLLVTKKATVPASAAIDDDEAFGNVDDELGGEEGVGSEQRGRRTASARKEDNLMSVLKELNKHNEEANLTSAQMLQVMRGETPGVAMPNSAARGGLPPAETGESLLNRTMCEMQGTEKYIAEKTSELKKLQKKRKRLAANGTGNAKKIRRLDNEIEDAKATIITLEAVKKKHRTKLSTLCKSTGDVENPGEIADSDEVDDNDDSDSDGNLSSDDD